MDVTHIIALVLAVVGIAVPVVGFVLIARILRKDEAIDAATFLALRQLEEYVKRSK